MTALIIVESPAKAKTIKNYLGKDFTVLSSLGHVRAIVPKPWAIEVDNDFFVHYERIEKSNSAVNSILKAISDASSIYIATDPDREGEAIGWHLKEIILSEFHKGKKTKKKVSDNDFQRIAFHEITKNAILKAIKTPRSIDMSLVSAQQARSTMDHLVGFSISPLLWSKLPGTKSAGRVQSIALMMICDKENSIDNFSSQEYWTAEGSFKFENGGLIVANLHSIDGKNIKKLDIPNKSCFDDIFSKINVEEFQITSIDNKSVFRSPVAPFITSSLQQEASKIFNFSPKMTMSVAQKLYEGIKIKGSLVGLITYMRTDSTSISKDSIDAIRELINKKYGAKYLPEKPNLYKKTVKNAQEAHEAIRPTSLEFEPIAVKSFLSDSEFKIYDLIWRRAIASQMSKAEFSQTTIVVSSKKAVFKSSQTLMNFDGFLLLYGNTAQENESREQFSLVQKMGIGAISSSKTISGKQHFTIPPSRYSESSIIKSMEELGIGRPSTYASILSVIQDRGYVYLQNKSFYPSQRGRALSAFLKIFFNTCMQYDFTAKMEENLDLIASNAKSKLDVLKEFWKEFSPLVDNVKSLDQKSVIKSISENSLNYIFPNAIDGLDKKCEKCDLGKMNLNFGRFGFFLGCSNYPDCKHVLRIADSSEDDNNKFESRTFKLTSGTDAELKKGPFGYYIEFICNTSKKIKRVSVPKAIDIDSIDDDIANKICSIPIKLGNCEKTNEDIFLGCGIYGPYIKIGSKFASIPQKEQSRMFDIEAQEAYSIFEKKIASKKGVAKKVANRKKKTTKTTKATKAAKKSS